MSKPTPNRQDILNFLKFLYEPETVFELCVIAPTETKSQHWKGSALGKKPIVAGWFRDHDKAAALAAKVQAAGIYVTLNPCHEALLGRANERLIAGADRTKDEDILRVRNLLIDIDPVRPSGVSSSDKEHAAALDMAQEMKNDLTASGWPDPLASDSGNGAGLIYAVDLPNTPETTELSKSLLKALEAKYAKRLASLGLSLDTGVFNAARLTRFLGTPNCKGDSTEDRPHRLPKIVSMPETRQLVPVELLEREADKAGGAGGDAGGPRSRWTASTWLPILPTTGWT
jgi:hypothetical protein